MGRLLTMTGLARELGVSIPELQRWIEQGVVPSPRGPGARVFTEDQARRIRSILAKRRTRRWPYVGLRI